MNTLFSNLLIRKVNFKNRIFISPMCQYSAMDGEANNWHMVHLGSRAIGGASLIIFEATSVSPEGRISPNDLGIWNDKQQHKLQPITEFIKSNGSIAGIQLAHAGRKASTSSPWSKTSKVLDSKNGGWTCLAPSAIAFDTNYPTPLEMDQFQIEKVISDFANAAKRSSAAGFEVLELHFAHGYLLHEFLSPLSNKRTDQYGGTLENRMRLPLEVAKAVRGEWPEELPLFVRISATDWVDGGWTLEDSLILSAKLKTIGVDFIDCSSGGLAPNAQIKVAANYQVPFATAIKEKTQILTGAVGLISDAQQANNIILNSKADAVLIGRASLRDPYWPLHAAKTLGVDISYPKQYERAK